MAMTNATEAITFGIEGYDFLISTLNKLPGSDLDRWARNGLEGCACAFRRQIFLTKRKVAGIHPSSSHRNSCVYL